MRVGRFGPELWAPGLGALMFAAAIKLTVSDFARVALTPGTVALGFCVNWVIKPLLALLFVKAFAMDAGAAIGLLMVRYKHSCYWFKSLKYMYVFV